MVLWNIAQLQSTPNFVALMIYFTTKFDAVYVTGAMPTWVTLYNDKPVSNGNDNNKS